MLDKIIGLIAPFYCIICSEKGYLLCPGCEAAELPIAPSRCYRCHKNTIQHQVCIGCRKQVKLKRLFVVTTYDGHAKDLVEKVKFERAKAGTKDIARILAANLPIFNENTLLCYCPTASKRIRIRGYDQSGLIARHLAKNLQLEYRPIIKRTSAFRQVGSSREVRFTQARKSYMLHPNASVMGKDILLIDDVTTSGATLEAVAGILKAAGAREVNGVVFAQAVS